MLLKDGTELDDPRLDRLVQFDPRSRNFPLQLDQRTPRSYTWRCAPRFDQGREGACFPAGTLIRLSDGSHRNIEELQLLDNVVTAEGSTGQVKALMVRWHEDGLIAIRLRGLAAVSMTAEHPVLTKRGYVPAKDLNLSDYVAVTRNKLGSLQSINLHQFISHRSPSRRMKEVSSYSSISGPAVIVRKSAPPESLQLTPDLGRLFGLYLAEGGLSNQKVTWTFGRHERETLVMETAGLIEECLGVSARIQERTHSLNVVIYGVQWREVFEGLFGDCMDNKRVGILCDGPTDFLQSMLQGWLAGDGHRRKDRIQGVTVSKRIAYDMYGIAQYLGLRPTLTKTTPKLSHGVVSRRNRYDLTIPEGGGLNLQEQTDAAVWRKVSSITTEEWRGYVYNISVSGDESYVANGIGVHNCVAFGIGHELASRPAEVEGLNDSYLKQSIYWEAQKIDPWQGGEYPGASPRYGGTSVLAGVKVAQSLGYFESYRWTFSLHELILGIGHHGPAVLGLAWHEGMFTPDSSGYLYPQGSISGGHCVCARGVDIPRKRFLLRNSWGITWGQGGDFYLRFEDMEKLLSENGEAVFFLKRKTKV